MVSTPIPRQLAEMRKVQKQIDEEFLDYLETTDHSAEELAAAARVNQLARQLKGMADTLYETTHDRWKLTHDVYKHANPDY